MRRALSSNIHVPASQKGVYLFYNPPNNISRGTHADHSCIPCGFFGVSLCGIVEIKSDHRYQIEWQISSDICRLILYPVVSFIQREPAEFIFCEL